MSKNKITFWIGFLIFVGLLVVGLWREVDRNLSQISTGFSGTVHADPSVAGSIVKTDMAHVLLFEAESKRLVADHMLDTFIPPVTFNVGQKDAFNVEPLKGYYRIQIITDKDGDLNSPAPGELMGPMTEPLQLGNEGIQYVLDRPYQISKP